MLIVATYDDEAANFLKRRKSNINPGQDKFEDARDIAETLFGRRITNEDGKLTIIPPKLPLTTLFTYVDAFEHFGIPDNINVQGLEAEKIRDRRYGWFALMPESNLDFLKFIIGWPDHPFCNVFDIQIIPLQGTGIKYHNTLAPDEAWLEQGADVYQYQTPSSWKK